MPLLHSLFGIHYGYTSNLAEIYSDSGVKQRLSTEFLMLQCIVFAVYDLAPVISVIHHGYTYSRAEVYCISDIKQRPHCIQIGCTVSLYIGFAAFTNKTSDKQSLFAGSTNHYGLSDICDPPDRAEVSNKTSNMT